MLRAGLGRDRRRDGFVSLEVDAASSPTTPRARSSRRAHVLGAASTGPNVMIKIPGTDEGVPAIEQAIYEGINVNVTLLFAVEPYVKRRRGLHPRARAPPGRGQVARRPLGRVVLRLARRHRGRQAPRGARHAPTCAGTAAARQRARRLPCVQGDLRRRALRGRCATPARRVQRPLWASTGVKNPRYPETHVRRRAGRAATRSTRCRWRRCSPRPSSGEVTGATADERPDRRRSTRSREAGIDMRRRHRQAAARRHRRVRRRRWTSCSPGSSRSARRSSPGRPPTIESVDPRRARGSRSPQRVEQAADEDVARAHLAQATRRCGRPPARPRSPTGSAG